MKGFHKKSFFFTIDGFPKCFFIKSRRFSANVRSQIRMMWSTSLWMLWRNLPGLRQTLLTSWRFPTTIHLTMPIANPCWNPTLNGFDLNVNMWHADHYCFVDWAGREVWMFLACCGWRGFWIWHDIWGPAFFTEYLYLREVQHFTELYTKSCL